MEILIYFYENASLITRLTLEHIEIVGVAVGLAILTGVPIGIAITQNDKIARAVLYCGAVTMTIPSVALFGIMIPILSLIGKGVGFVPTVIALFLYSQLPIISNTYAAITNVDPALREAARGMGMTTLERLRRVEIPIALPLIMAGVRMAVVINVGIATIATYIGAGGLGKLISRGISQSDNRQLIVGAIMVSLLAIAADYVLALIQNHYTPTGLRDRKTSKSVVNKLAV